MAELASKPKRRGGRYCVAGAPNNQSFQNTLFSPGVTIYAPVPHRHSFAGKMDKICQKTLKRLKAGREVHIAVLCTLRGILLQLSYSAGGDTDESNINKRISTNAWYNYSKSAFFSVSILILSRDILCFLLYLKLKLSFMGTDRSLPGRIDFGTHYP